jgi:arginine/lysine/ornithine decarboxylase
MGRSINESIFQRTFEEVLGTALLDHDVSYSGEIFDTPILPTGVCELSRRQTAVAFDASYSSMVTTGTTIANHIVVRGFVKPGCRVLADRTSHLSIHMSLSTSGCRVTYGRSRQRDFNSGRQAIDMQAFLEAYTDAAIAGDPFEVVVLSGCSYEGLFIDLVPALKAFIDVRDNVTFIIDEAWFAFAPFHPSYRAFTAMYAAQAIRNERPKAKFRVLSTQSAHKSLSAMRQGSFIHLYGDTKDIESLRSAQCAIDTTSPSIPILASLELARAQAVLEGKDLITRALRRADRVRLQIQSDPQLASYFINESLEYLDEWTRIDPLRLSINCSRVCDDPKSLKTWLFDRSNVYINYATPTSVLLNIHIGITDEAVDQLLDGLRTFAVERATEDSAAAVGHPDGAVADAYIIPYPPGRPIVVPGEALSKEIRVDLLRQRRTGIRVLTIKPSVTTRFDPEKE